MSDFVSQDTLPELWKEILKRHWTYLETEESIQKLEERKKLEGCLKKLLCMVRHDRKFFLPETALVLKNSIREHSNFNAQKAIGAFEAISQYANNLFTKPWRKEFRILKMYSGFFQHEIQSCLIDAEKLFEAMGYRRLSDDTLILDGPICPDQVTNVSRDAMTVYVELQIMKHIYMSLDANDIPCSWLEIFRYREKHIGGISQAVKDLHYAAEESRFRSRENALMSDNYGYIDVQPSSNYTKQQCTAQCQCSVPYHQIPLTPRQRMANSPCCVHEFNRSHPPNMMYGNMNYPSYHHRLGIGNETPTHLPLMSHSRSLEQYSEPASLRQTSMLPHRHSFDNQQQGCSSSAHHQHQHQPQQRLHHILQQQQMQHYRNPSQNLYESPYERIDENSLGGSSISYAAVAASGVGGSDMPGGPGLNYNNINISPYNVSGNRFPLPYNISHQFSSSYENNSAHMSMEPTYATGLDNNHMYAQVSKLPQTYMMNSSMGMTHSQNHTLQTIPQQNSSSMISANEPVQMHEQSSDQLIDFRDPPIIPPPHAAQFDPYHQQCHHDAGIKGKRNNKLPENDMNISGSINYKQSDKETQNYSNSVSNRDDTYVYAKPIPKDSRQTNKNLQNMASDPPYARKAPFTSAEGGYGGGDTTDMSYESANDDFSNMPRQHQRSPTQFTKNQDGVGSFESWNYVYKNLERSGYTKDLGEREDLLVKSLDLDSMNITNESTTPSQSSSVDKRRSIHKETENQQLQQTMQHQLQTHQTKQKPRPFDVSGGKQFADTSPPAVKSNNTNKKQKPQIDNKKHQIKSALKQTGPVARTNSKPTTNNLSKSNDNKSKAINNDNNNSLVASTQSSVKKNSEGKAASSAAAAAIVTGTNEWSCRTCTFINPNTARICEMCYRTNENILNSSSPGTTTTPTAVSHTTPTCV